MSGARGRNVCRLSFPRSLLAERFLDLTAMAEQQQFYILLGNLMSPDNDIRKQSEVRSQNILSRSIAPRWGYFLELANLRLAQPTCEAEVDYGLAANVN